jgi:hypothetical protein
MGEIRQPGYRPTGENRSAARGEAGEVPELLDAAQFGLAWLAVGAMRFSVSVNRAGERGSRHRSNAIP